MRVLVTGGAGFIGSHTVDALLGLGHDVRILDNLQKPVHLKGMPDWIPDEAEFVLGDIRDKAMWERCLERVEAVYHFAAYQDYLPDFSTFFHVNAVGTALLYEVAVEKKMDLAKVVVASSQFVQGEGQYKCRNADCRLRNADFPGEIRSEGQLKRGEWKMLCPECGEPGEWQWTAETYASPPNAYAMAKYSQEMQAMTFGRRYGIPSVALRYSIVQGPRQSFYNAYSGACRIFSLSYYFGKSPTLFEDGLQCRDFVNIHDVVRANIMALEDDRMDYGVFNVGGGRAYTVKDFAEIVRKVSTDYAENGDLTQRRKGTKGSADYADSRRLKKGEKTLPLAEVPGIYRFGDTRNACSDISKIKALGWEAQNSPEDSVREYVDWLYEQDNVEDILGYAEKMMKDSNVIRSADVIR